jgi:hypothetical protein
VPLATVDPVDIVSVDLPEPGTLLGLNDALVRAGKPLTLNVSVEVNGPRAETVTVYVVLEFFVTVWLLGEAEIEKSATESFTWVEWVRVPLVAVIVRVEVPVGVELEVFTVKVEDPEPETELGAKLAVAPEGNPVTLKLTFPVNPLEGVTLTV